MSFKKSKENTPNTRAPDERKVFVYLGPSIRGIIVTGRIFTGDKKKVLDELKPVLDKYPKIARLVVADNEIVAANEKIRTSGNSLNAAYSSLLAATKEV